MKNKILKRGMAVLLAGMLMLMSCVSVFAEDAEPTVTVFVDGTQILFDVDPILENGRTLVPMRYIFEALGAQVEWVEETQTAVGVKGEKKVEITIDSNQMLKNGEVVELDVPAKLVDGRTLVPVRAVSEGLDAKVEWDGELFQVKIFNPSTEKESYTLSELSPADMEILKTILPEFRYTYEQQLLPEYLFEIEAGLSAAIQQGTADLPSAFYEDWNYLLYEVIMQIQMESASTYTLEGEVSDETLVAGYDAILKSAGMDAESIFEASYAITPEDRAAVLLAFHEGKSDDPMLITCKYIAVVADNGGLRYFTAEYSPISAELLGQEVYMLCEITPEGRKNYGTVSIEKDAFLSAIDAVMDGE